MKKYTIVFIFFLFFPLNNAFSQDKVVFIDINFIFNNSNAGKELQSQISKKNLDLQSEIKDYKSEIEDKRKKILSQKNVLSAEKYNLEVSNLEKEIKSINLIISSKNDELTIFKGKVENSFSKSLNQVIEVFSVENSIDIILNKENILMAKKDLDITEEIFNLFNDKVKIINIK